MSFTYLKSTVNAVPVADLVAAVMAKNKKFSTKNGAASPIDARIASMSLSPSVQAAVRGLVADVYDDFGEDYPEGTLQTPVKFVDGSVLVYKGETVLAWIGNKGVDIEGHDLIFNRYDHTMRAATASEVTSFLNGFLGARVPATRRARRRLRLLGKIIA